MHWSSHHIVLGVQELKAKVVIFLQTEMLEDFSQQYLPNSTLLLDQRMQGVNIAKLCTVIINSAIGNSNQPAHQLVID